jgi:hypothetical protein
MLWLWCCIEGSAGSMVMLLRGCCSRLHLEKYTGSMCSTAMAGLSEGNK